jgi:hypothetical protein
MGARGRYGGHPRLPRSLWLTFTAATAATGYSLADEARFTSGHRSTAFAAGKKLRHMPISFISAGCLEGTIKDTLPGIVEPAPPSPLNSDTFAQMTIHSPHRSASVSSLASSASSDEVIVFRGRGNTPLNASLRKSVATSSVTPGTVASSSARRASDVASAAHKVQATIPCSTTVTTATTAFEHDTPSTDTPQLTGTFSDEQILFHTHSALESLDIAPDPSVTPQCDFLSDSDANSVNDALFEKRRGGKPIWQGKTTDWTSRSKPGVGWLPVRDRPDMDGFLRGEVDPRQAAMDDYMQNVEAFGLREELTASTNFFRREMDLDGGSHNEWQESGQPQGRGVTDEDWNSDTLRDLDGMSTSSDVMDTVVRILNKRLRTTGAQYLVVYEGSAADDARWLPASFLKTPTEQTLIQKFETDLISRPQPSTDESDSDAAFYDDEEESDGDEELDDETMARVLQKQEELGLGSEELLLYAADEYFGGSASRSAGATSSTFDRPSRRRQHRVGGGRRAEQTFPSASAMADALDMNPYGAFDIMDTERPSLRPVKKGRRGQMPPELEDSDLNDQLQATWETDRDKKRLKKAEREELRKQGLLGRKGQTPDLSVKYKDGFNMMEVMEEIRSFMSSNVLTLSLPPMEAHRRAMVHQVVRLLGINSKSRGDGGSRFTILSKTRRTVTFDDDAFDAMLEQPKFKRRMQAAAYPPQQRGPKAYKGKKSRPVVGYKDGDVVGASAPELGPENKGRALMEKMGWSKGMALGAHDNKGILHPIAHTVKTNKAGLQ